MQLLRENCKSLSEHAVLRTRAGAQLGCFKPPALLQGTRPGWKAARAAQSRGLQEQSRGPEADLGARWRSRVCWAQPMTVPGSQERGRRRGFMPGSGLVGGDVDGVGAMQQRGKAFLLFSGDEKSP